VETIEPGITYTHAPSVWAEGFFGQGIVVAGADTGIRRTHNALKPHYRGWNGSTADHDYNWHDSIHDSVGNPCGNDSPEPCDDAATVLTPWAQYWVTITPAIRLEWRHRPNLLVAETWTKVTAHLLDIWSALSSSLLPTQWVVHHPG
jgi:hypothetical protein